MPRIFPYLGLFVSAVLLQIFLFDNLSISVYLNPLVYIVFIAMIPLDARPVTLLGAGLLLGVTMDFAMGAEKRNAAQMETLLDSSINGVMRLDGEGKVLSANPAMEQMMGKEEREVTGSSLWAIFPETEREGLKKALETGEEIL